MNRTQLITRFFREPLATRLRLTARLLRGFSYYPRFNSKHLVLAGSHLHVERRFGEIHLGQLVWFGQHVTLAAISPDRDRPALIEIGAYTHLEDRTHINCEERVTIGAQCAISWDVEILDTDFHTVISAEGEPLSHCDPVVIEDRVWIGAHCIVLKGVAIGHDSVIAAGSVVTGSIPPYSLAAGTPARVIREIQGWKP